jgi:hypothetical protein
LLIGPRGAACPVQVQAGGSHRTAEEVRLWRQPPGAVDSLLLLFNFIDLNFIEIGTLSAYMSNRNNLVNLRVTSNKYS